MLLYIHIPFCESKCHYCAFGSLIGKEKFAENYFKAMIADFKEQISKFGVLKNGIESVFFGGGTPSVIDAGFYENLFFEISPFLTGECEITTEANPNSADKIWLEKMKRLGVNRVSFGAQSFFEDKLKFLGRIHDAKHIYEAIENAKIAGFNNINIDLIYDTKFDTKKRLAEEAQNIENLDVSHVSAYSLTLEAGTPFYRKKEYKKDSPILARFLIRQIENLGLKQYEISNFGRICKHNLGYWQGKNYLAIGAYSIGFFNDYRFYAPLNLDAYIKNPLEKNYERLRQEELKTERIFLGARSCVGISATDLSDAERQRAEILRKNGKLKFEKGRYFVKNFLLADEISLFIAD